MIIFKKAVALVVLDNKARSFSFRHSTQFRTAGLWIRMVDSQFFACCYYHISTENCCESINTGVEVFLALGSLPNTLNRWHSVPWSLVLFKYKFFQITCIVYDNTMCHVIHVLCLKPTSPQTHSSPLLPPLWYQSSMCYLTIKNVCRACQSSILGSK